MIETQVETARRSPLLKARHLSDDCRNAIKAVSYTHLDDIANLNERVDAVEKGLEALKNDFGALGYVKDVTFANGKLTVTNASGTPVTYDIPDTNTTYSLDVAQNGNACLLYTSRCV